tara:strand:+ start:450 stop:1295 length:846 start_codon:yes stop_codon:yes gene_type:complete
MLKKIFKSAKKLVQKAAPVIGAGLGYLYGGPALGGALGSGLGAGIGSLVGGRSPQESLRNALLGGAAGFGATKFLGMTPGAGLSGLLGRTAPILGTGTTGGAAGSGLIPGAAGKLTVKAPQGLNALQKAAAFVKTRPLTSAAILAGATGLMGSEQEQKDSEMMPGVFGTVDPFKNLGAATTMPVTTIPFSQYGPNLINRRDGGIIGLSEGGNFPRKNGKIAGPGTETSDEIPAMLSDGEFVVNARTVRGLGQAMGGKGKQDTRDRGSKFLYSLQEKYGGKR